MAGGESAPNVSGVIGVDHPSSSARRGSSSAPGRIVVARLLRVARRARRVVARGRRRARGAAHQGRHPHGDRRQVELGRFGSFPRPRFATLSVASNDPSADPAIVRAAREETAKKSRRTAGAVSLGRVVRPGRAFLARPQETPSRARPRRGARARARSESARRADERARRDPIGSGERSRGGAGGGGSGRDLEARRGCPEVFFNRARKHATGAGHTDEKSPI